MNFAAIIFAPLHVSGLAVAEVTAVVPISQITFDVTAAHFVSLNKAAPIPQSENGLGPEPGVLSKANEFTEDAQKAILAIARKLADDGEIMLGGGEDMV